MRFTVLWRDEVHNDLAQLWVDSAIRPQLTSAADRIDVELADDAHLKGLEIGDDRKVLRSLRSLSIFASTSRTEKCS
jgi:hypothetical protein